MFEKRPLCFYQANDMIEQNTFHSPSRPSLYLVQCPGNLTPTATFSGFLYLCLHSCGWKDVLTKGCPETSKQ